MVDLGSEVIKRLIADYERKITKLNNFTISEKSSIDKPTLDLELDTADLDNLSDQVKTQVSSFVQYISQDITLKLDQSIEAFGVVDSGALKNSLIVAVSENTVNFSYNVPYAALQHYGGYILPYGNRNAQPVYIKPRPWMDAVFNDYDFDQAFNSVGSL